MKDARKRIGGIVAALRRAYPRSRTALAYETPLQILVATILSAQCTDERVNRITPALFKKYPAAADFARARQDLLEAEIRPAGFFRNKARNIIAAAGKIAGEFGGRVPDSMEELVTLPGVARKTANVVLGNAFGVASGVVVDTHVFRLAHRMGFTTRLYADKVEEDLMALIPKKQWVMAAHVLIFHGRQVCAALRPRCADCAVAQWCPKLLDAPKPK